MNSKDRNQGEGNVDAARRYNDASEDFASSGEVEKHEKERRSAGKETREQLKRAEEKGKERIAETDPNVSRDFHKPTGS